MKPEPAWILMGLTSLIWGFTICPAGAFGDTRNHWNEACLNQLAQRRLVSGYPDGSFRPDATVTRAEFAVLMLNAFPEAPVWQTASLFGDVSERYWAYQAIRDASARRFFTGYPDGQFRPQQPIPRVQAMAVISNARRPDVPDIPSAVLDQYFEDAEAIPNYAQAAIAASARQWWVVNYPQVRQFRPNDRATRAEVAALLCRALGMPQTVPTAAVARPHPLLAILPEEGTVAHGAEGLLITQANGRFGYRDRSGNLVITPQYDSVLPFSEQRAAVGITPDAWGTRWGYIDPEGNTVVEPQFFRVEPFAEGLAAVGTEGGKYGFIDKTGQFAITPQFDQAQSFSEGLAAVQVSGQWQYIDQEGQVAIAALPYDEVRPFSEGRAKVKQNHRYGFIDTRGQAIVAPQFEAAESFSEGLAAVRPPVEDEQVPMRWGYINLAGEMVISPRFVQAQSFSEGLAGVGFNLYDGLSLYTDPSPADVTWGFITPTGQFGIEPQFYAPVQHIPEGDTVVYEGAVVRPFSQGLAMARLGEQVGFIDKTGAFVVAPAFTDAESFQNGLARVRLGGVWGLRVENPYPDLGPPSAYYTEISGGEYGYIRYPDSRDNL